jgi:hypothetical protein
MEKRNYQDQNREKTQLRKPLLVHGSVILLVQICYFMFRWASGESISDLSTVIGFSFTQKTKISRLFDFIGNYTGCFIGN